MRRACRHLLWVFAVVVSQGPLRAQRPTDVSAPAVNAPELILYNGKIVTMDDQSFSSEPGTVAQAISVRDGRILAIGTADLVLRTAGPQTRKIDLKGRTVLPGLVDTHDHLHDWVISHEAVVAGVLSDRDIVVREVPGTNEKELEENFVPVLRRALDVAKPGQWIHLNPARGRQNELQEVSRGLINNGKIGKELLDKWATKNPVIVRAATTILLNQVAIEEMLKVFPPGSQSDYAPPESLVKTGVGSVPDNRAIVPNVIFKDHIELLAELYKREMEWWAGYGITTWHSSVESSNVLAAYNLLDQKGGMPIRFGWSYSLDVRNYTPYLIQTLAILTRGKGSPYLWLTGVATGAINSCTSLPISASPESRGGTFREDCTFRPGSDAYKAVKELVKAGIPVRNLHTGPLADKDLDYFLQAIAEGAREANLSEDQVRAQRQAMDHCWGVPRPDQIPLLKRFGIIASCKPLYAYFELVDDFPLYGERWAEWVVPRKSLIDAGIMTTTEIDRAIGTMAFTPFSVNLYTDVSRLSRDGKVYVPKERIDRVRALKAHTIWGAHYVFKERELGSLEPGKWADFIILDRDYLTIPEGDIPKIKVLATSVGGKFVHVRREIGTDLGESPKGTQALAP